MNKKSNKKRLKLSSLSFLQSKILEVIYLAIDQGLNITKKEIASVIHYKENSKIYENALESLKDKGAILGNFKSGFKIPKEYGDLLEIIKTKNLKNKINYKDFSFHNKNIQKDLFYEFDFISLTKDLDKWYSYVEEFSSDLIQSKIKSEKLKKKFSYI